MPIVLQVRFSTASCSPRNALVSTITQVNIRYTWHKDRPEKEKFWKKCEDLDKWRESEGKPILRDKDGWLWREHDHPDQDIGTLLTSTQAYNVCVCVSVCVCVRARARACVRLRVNNITYTRSRS